MNLSSVVGTDYIVMQNLVIVKTSNNNYNTLKNVINSVSSHKCNKANVKYFHNQLVLVLNLHEVVKIKIPHKPIDNLSHENIKVKHLKRVKLYSKRNQMLVDRIYVKLMYVVSDWLVKHL